MIFHNMITIMTVWWILPMLHLSSLNTQNLQPNKFFSIKKQCAIMTHCFNFINLQILLYRFEMYYFTSGREVIIFASNICITAASLPVTPSSPSTSALSLFISPSGNFWLFARYWRIFTESDIETLPSQFESPGRRFITAAVVSVEVVSSAVVAVVEVAVVDRNRS